jgi:hypothetical protein
MCRVYGGGLSFTSRCLDCFLFLVGWDTQGLLGVSRQLYVGIGHTLWYCGLWIVDWAFGGRLGLVASSSDGSVDVGAE